MSTYVAKEGNVKANYLLFIDDLKLFLETGYDFVSLIKNQLTGEDLGMEFRMKIMRKPANIKSPIKTNTETLRKKKKKKIEKNRKKNR